jgi:hypothetical protein
MTTTFGPPGRSSRRSKSRPTIGEIPKVLKKSADTRVPVRRSGDPAPMRLNPDPSGVVRRDALENRAASVAPPQKLRDGHRVADAAG